MKYIIYIQDSGSIAVICPTSEALQFWSIEQIAKKDVPSGKKFKIVDSSDLPDDIYPIESWSVSENDLTDGVGNQSNEFED